METRTKTLSIVSEDNREEKEASAERRNIYTTAQGDGLGEREGEKGRESGRESGRERVWYIC